MPNLTFECDEKLPISSSKEKANMFHYLSQKCFGEFCCHVSFIFRFWNRNFTKIKHFFAASSDPNFLQLDCFAMRNLPEDLLKIDKI